jgi:histidyl-tRNA synthetase
MEKKQNLSTDPYKGTRDFYPQDMAIQRYIFDTWAKTAELFGFERYDASILEPSELYRSKTSEEIVNEQTYTFIDRGDREVTLRPEMTPTVARMIVAKRRELSFPTRWYSIPNLFRYERPQRGRLREHWQLNCDMFGADNYVADVEMIALAYNVLKAFGAKDSDFEIRINNRQLMYDWFVKEYGITDRNEISDITRILDRRSKVTEKVFEGEITSILRDSERYEKFRNQLELDLEPFVQLVRAELKNSPFIKTKHALSNLGIDNVKFDATLARGFDYYTGTIFEIFDTSSENNRSLLGGGRYDNLTGLFGGDPVSGIGFGMGDVTMRDFLETHNLLPKNIHVTAPTLMIIPLEEAQNMEGEKIAHSFRTAGISTAVDIGTRKMGKKISSAGESGSRYILVVGENEVSSQVFILKELATKSEQTGTVEALIKHIL